MTWRGLFALLILCLLLAGAVVLERRDPERFMERLPASTTGQVAAAAPQAGGGGGPAGNTYRPPGDTAFQVIEERPLFAQDRLPFEKDSAQTDDGPAPPQSLTGLALTGIITGGGERIAIVQLNSPPRPGAESWSLRVGGDLRGWTVEEIGEDYMVLVNGASRHRMELVDDPARRPQQRQRQPAPNTPRRQQQQPAQPAQPVQPRK